MATTTVQALPYGDVSALDDSNLVLLPVVDKIGRLRKITIDMLRYLLGTITLTGDVVGSGVMGVIGLTIAPKAVSFSKMQDIPSQVLLGRWSPATGTMQTITLDSSLTLSPGGILSASAPASAAPSATLDVYKREGSF